MPKNIKFLTILIIGIISLSSSAHAAVDSEVSYILNTLLFLIVVF